MVTDPATTSVWPLSYSASANTNRQARQKRPGIVMRCAGPHARVQLQQVFEEGRLSLTAT